MFIGNYLKLSHTQDFSTTLPVCLGEEPKTLDPALNIADDGMTILSHLFSGLAKWEKDSSGTAMRISGRYCQFSEPNTSRYTVVNSTTATTPQAEVECSLLISRSGSSEGTAAITGLISTSPNPAEAEKITVPSKRPTKRSRAVRRDFPSLYTE